jgi:hypothetical protein
MAPPSRSPALPHLSTPRDIYTGATPHLRRASDLLSRSPSASGALRGVPLSPSSSGGFQSPTNMENSLGGQGASPPLEATEVLHQLQSSDGQFIKPEIFGKIDKGFFMADNDWTCYRRNYFSLNCSYTLHPAIPNGNLHLVQHGGATAQIHGFALSIAAVVDGRDGKSIELVQHTPKRDKGPQDKPARIPVAPRPPPSSMLRWYRKRFTKSLRCRLRSKPKPAPNRSDIRAHPIQERHSQQWQAESSTTILPSPRRALRRCGPTTCRALGQSSDPNVCPNGRAWPLPRALPKRASGQQR